MRQQALDSRHIHCLGEVPVEPSLERAGDIMSHTARPHRYRDFTDKA